jgi:hypothetical protein
MDGEMVMIFEEDEKHARQQLAGSKKWKDACDDGRAP